MLDGKVHLADNRMRSSDVVGAFSYVLDLTEGQPAGHSLRCAWIGMHVGQALALTPPAIYPTCIIRCC